MFLKKTAVLAYSPKSGKRELIACRISQNGNICTVNVSAIGTVGIFSNGITDFSKLNNGTCRLSGDISGNFAIALFCGDKEFFGGNGHTQDQFNLLKREYVKKFNKQTQVNTQYNDFAIATENYYAEYGEINAPFYDLMYDKGDFFKKQENIGCQYSTIYPQIVDGLTEAQHESKSRSDTPAERGAAEAHGKQTQTGSEACHIQDEDGERNDKDRSSNGNSPADGENDYNKRIKEIIYPLFSRFPRERNLEEAIDNSRFVKINYSDNKFYAVGITEFEGKAEYAVFGIPFNKGQTPPEELLQSTYYVPTKSDCGYRLFFRRADTGEIVKKGK